LKSEYILSLILIAALGDTIVHSIEEQSIYFKKEVVHGWYSPMLGRVSLKDAGLNEWKYDKKVGLRLEAKK
jgi:hypothetical protein